MNPTDTTTQDMLDRIATLEAHLLQTSGMVVALAKQVDGLTSQHRRAVLDLVQMNAEQANVTESCVRDLRTQIEPLIAERLPRLAETIDEITNIVGISALWAAERSSARAPLPDADPNTAAKN